MAHGWRVGTAAAGKPSGMDSASKLVARAGARARAVVAASEAPDAGAPDRSYRLHVREHVPDGIRRIARGQLVDGHAQLADASGRDLGEAVHETRKRLKRLRALVRLSRDAIGDEAYERENTAFRMAGRRLSGARDAQVLLETLDAIGERFADELPERVTADLRAHLRDEHERAQTQLRENDSDTTAVLQTLTDAVARTPAWTFEDDDDFAALAPGLRRVYARGRKRMRAARRDPGPENLHEWRKRVKDLWHATQVVRRSTAEEAQAAVQARARARRCARRRPRPARPARVRRHASAVLCVRDRPPGAAGRRRSARDGVVRAGAEARAQALRRLAEALHPQDRAWLAQARRRRAAEAARGLRLNGYPLTVRERCVTTPLAGSIQAAQ